MIPEILKSTMLSSGPFVAVRSSSEGLEADMDLDLTESKVKSSPFGLRAPQNLGLRKVLLTNQWGIRYKHLDPQ